MIFALFQLVGAPAGKKNLLPWASARAGPGCWFLVGFWMVSGWFLDGFWLVSGWFLVLIKNLKSFRAPPFWQKKH